MAIVERHKQELDRNAGPEDRAPAVIEFRGVSKSYGPTNGGVDAAAVTIQRGEFVFLFGSPGSAKSTLMKSLIKKIQPTAGTIMVAGRALSEITRKKVPFYRRNI